MSTIKSTQAINTGAVVFLLQHLSWGPEISWHVWMGWAMGRGFIKLSTQLCPLFSRSTQKKQCRVSGPGFSIIIIEQSESCIILSSNCKLIEFKIAKRINPIRIQSNKFLLNFAQLTKRVGKYFAYSVCQYTNSLKITSSGYLPFIFSIFQQISIFVRILQLLRCIW